MGSGLLLGVAGFDALREKSTQISRNLHLIYRGQSRKIKSPIENVMIRNNLTHDVVVRFTSGMTDTVRTLTSFEALGNAGMMMAGRNGVMCCRMCR